MPRHSIICGDVFEELQKLEPQSFDGIFGDPPYGFPGGFMGRSWDKHDGREDAGFGYWLAGFADGEGCFSVARHSRGSHACHFTIGVRADDFAVLQRIRHFVGFGSLTDKCDRTAANPMRRYQVQCKAGCERVVDIFRKYPLAAKKALDFEIWAEAVEEWTGRPRGNRWRGPADQSRAASLKARLEDIRRYVDVPWSGHRFQDWCRRWLAGVYRVLKPGANVVAASSSKTYHRLAAAAEDAGLTLNPLFAHIQSQSMAQGGAIDKLIDKAAGAEREVVGIDPAASNRESRFSGSRGGGILHGVGDITAPATPAARLWAGYGTRLKDAVTPWLMAFSPPEGTWAQSVQKWGCGGYNVDGGRVATDDSLAGGSSARPQVPHAGNTRPWEEDAAGVARLATARRERVVHAESLGRYPSNCSTGHAEACTADECAPGCAVGVLDGQSRAAGMHSAGAASTRGVQTAGMVYGTERTYTTSGNRHGDGDRGDQASRFFPQFRYRAKAGRQERLRGAESFFWRVDRDNPLGFVRISIDEWAAMDHRPGCQKRLKRQFSGGVRGRVSMSEAGTGKETGYGDVIEPELPLLALLGEDLPEPGCVEGCQHRQRYQGNIHPTLKSIELCTYLARLILPPPRADGKPRRLLVPFAGTGSEMIGALLAGWDEVVGIEAEAVYVEIGEARVAAWGPYSEAVVEQAALF